MIVLDIETTGVSFYYNGMLSLGAVDMDNGDEFYKECRVTEGREITDIALEINGFSKAAISDPMKKSDVEVYEDFVEWSKSRSNILGGHNIGHFDILFLEEIHTRSKYAKTKFPFSFRTVDLHSVAYAALGKSLTHSQICEALGLESEPKPHHALYGARSEAAAFKKLLKQLI
jgi:DNA polymerase-3 subunit epsilon